MSVDWLGFPCTVGGKSNERPSSQHIQTEWAGQRNWNSVSIDRSMSVFKQHFHGSQTECCKSYWSTVLHKKKEKKE